MTNIRTLAISTFCIITLSLTGLADQSFGQVKPFKFTGAGIVAAIPAQLGVPESFFVDGQATLMGNYHTDGFAQLDYAITATTFGISGSEVFTAANGDQVCLDFEGFVELTAEGSTWTAVATPVLDTGCNTGRFRKVIGGSILVVASTGPVLPGDPDVPFTWVGDGTLEFRRGR